MRSKKNRKKFITISIVTITCMILILLLSIAYIFIPKLKIELNGQANINIEYGETYKELGAKAYIYNLFSKKEAKVNIDGSVDETKLGKYKITYEADYRKFKATENRFVNVIDTEKPSITLVNEIKACKNNDLIEMDVKVNDNYDGDISDKLNYRVEGNNILLSAKDSSGNEEKVTEELHFIDEEKPSITLQGSNVIYLSQGDEYTEYGAKSYDSCDGDITKNIKINGKVDTNNPGTYEISYEITDSFGNVISITRKVIVSAKNDTPDDGAKVTNGVIYLTFDDGPGQYTEDFLNVLSKYNVKATFFVTGQFPKYYDLIKKEYEQGHTIGIHTYSHKWDIYDSVDAYWEDFTKIENIVYEQTGTHPKYFRFPGGSSNTVSRKHCEKIMTTLDQLMTEKGYVYFDWTFDSCDTCKNNSKADIIKTVKTYLKGDGNYIILMHDLKKHSLEALPEIIEYAKSKGYVFKPIDETTPVKHFKIAN